MIEMLDHVLDDRGPGEAYAEGRQGEDCGAFFLRAGCMAPSLDGAVPKIAVQREVRKHGPRSRPGIANLASNKARPERRRHSVFQAPLKRRLDDPLILSGQMPGLCEN